MQGAAHLLLLVIVPVDPGAVLRADVVALAALLRAERQASGAAAEALKAGRRAGAVRNTQLL